VTIIKNNETVPQPFANITIKAFLTFRSYKFSIADLLSDKINASTVGASSAYLSTVITDKPNCARALSDDNTQYACGSSDCVDVPNGGYSCTCSGSSDDGNPYLPDDCKQGTCKHSSTKPCPMFKIVCSSNVLMFKNILEVLIVFFNNWNILISLIYYLCSKLVDVDI
jgi:hypothetical protein